MQESIVILLRVQCRRKESSRSLSHLLMSFLLFIFVVMEQCIPSPTIRRICCFSYVTTWPSFINFVIYTYYRITVLLCLCKIMKLHDVAVAKGGYIHTTPSATFSLYAAGRE